jgi:hypothetical protein
MEIGFVFIEVRPSACTARQNEKRNARESCRDRKRASCNGSPQGQESSAACTCLRQMRAATVVFVASALQETPGNEHR